MAIIGQSLTAPEAGWRRIENSASHISYTNMIQYSDANASGGSYHYCSAGIAAKVKFNFSGKKLRLISYTAGSYHPILSVLIDGVESIYSYDNQTTIVWQRLMFDLDDLEDTEHFVEITNIGTSQFMIDAVDIDLNGTSKPYNPFHGITKTTVESMEIGDIIPCRYKATSGVAGAFSELGTCTASEIPTTGTATPDGLFYFRKVAKGLLLPDRVIQTNISWDALNNAKFIQGSFNTALRTTFTYSATPSSLYSDGGGNSVVANLNLADGGSGTAYTNFSVSNSDNSPQIKLNLGSSLNISALYLQWANTTKSNIGTVEVSNDDVEYTQVATFTIAPNERKFVNFNSVSAKYVKLKFNKVDVYGYNTVQIVRLRVGEGHGFDLLFRSMSGGVAYMGSDGNKSLTDQGLGAWPANNEWDKYIVNSDLNGAITAGDENVWHNLASQSWCQDTTILALYASTARTTRGYNLINGFTYNLATNLRGFRPALEYTEYPNSTNLWY